LGRLDGDLHRLVAEEYLDRDRHTFEIHLVPSVVRAANDCMRHELSSFRHP
jgi:hypothetical protein